MDFNDKRFSFEPGKHRDKPVIWVRFEKNQELINFLRAETRAWWSASQKCWYSEDNNRNRKLFGLEENVVGKAVFERIDPVNLPCFKRYQDQIRLKGYSDNTLRTYSIEFAQLLYILKSHPVNDLTPERLRSYFLYCRQKLKLSDREIHSRINAVKFYFEQVLHRPKMFFDIPRPKQPLSLPKMLSRSEIKKILEAPGNLKHRLMLKICYGMGLRVSEVVKLKTSDIDTETMMVRIEQAKGKKDRIVVLPDSLLNELQQYYNEYRPKKYLFEGQTGGQYSIRSVQQVFRSSLQKAGIHKRIGIHGLRHSYATHLLETGTDIRLIQELLGHRNLKTTEIYTHVSSKAKQKVKRPLDNLI